MRKLHFTLLLLISSLWASAQTFTVQGTVTTPSGPAISHVVIVRFDSLNTGTGFIIDSVLTDSSGFYSLTKTLPAGNPYPAIHVSTYNCNAPMLTNYHFGSPSTTTITSNFSICATGGGCNASFTFNPLGSLSFQFINIASPVNASFLWNFGDNTTSTQSNPTHTYNQAGTYNVCLIISAPGCMDTACITLQVTGSSNCIASFNTMIDTINPLTRHFFNTSPGGASGSLYTWNFGDGTSSTAFSPSKTYGSSGTYTVTLVRSGFGCVDSISQTITINGSSACMAAFSASNQPSSFTTWNFISNSSPSGLNHFWDFGDGTTSTQVNPTKTYTNPGTYTVSLFVTNQSGTCTDSAFGTVFAISSNPCQASFTHSINPSAPLTVNFQNTSNGPANSTYTWVYGDGTMATGFNPSKTYANPGTYSVALVIQAPNCVDSFYQTIIIGGNTAPMVSGNVFIGQPNQLAHPFEVYLIQYDSVAGTLTAVDTFFSTTTPSLLYNYYFNNVTPGDYLIKAALSANNPNFNNYMPTYLGSSLTWGSATTVTVGGGTATNILNINLIAGINPGGPGFVGGFVSQGANRTTGAGLKDHSVLITNTSGLAVSHTLTNVDGRFELPSLPYGSYYVWVEVPGKPSAQASITLNANTPSVDSLQFQVGSNGISLYVDQNNTITDLKLFPNPVQNQFQISFDCTGMRSANYQIINSTGQVVASKELNLSNGCANTFEVDVNQLAKGLYFVKLNADDKNGSLKFIKY